MERSSESLSVLTSSMGGSSAVLLTPGRTRNIAQDMEAIRLSRQDNPYLQQVMASRESLIESHADECESDDTILMSQELGSTGTALDLVEDDPLTLKEVHEHMIRSPPPTSCWSHEGVSLRTSSAFDFSASPLPYADDDKDSYTSRSPRSRRAAGGCGGGECGRARSSRSVSPRSHDLALCGRPLSLPGESHLRSALSKKSASQASEKFSLLQHPRPLRRPRDNNDDSLQLVHNCDK